MLKYFIAIPKLQHHLPSTPFLILEVEIEWEAILLQIEVSTYFGHMFYAYLFHLNSNYFIFIKNISNIIYLQYILSVTMLIVRPNIENVFICVHQDISYGVAYICITNRNSKRIYVPLPNWWKIEMIVGIVVQGIWIDSIRFANVQLATGPLIATIRNNVFISCYTPLSRLTAECMNKNEWMTEWPSVDKLPNP